MVLRFGGRDDTEEPEVLGTLTAYDEEQHRPSLYAKVQDEDGDEIWFKDGVPVDAYAEMDQEYDILADDELDEYLEEQDEGYRRRPSSPLFAPAN